MRENREVHTSKRKKRPTAKKYAKQRMTKEEHRKHLKRLYLKTLLITLAVCLALLGAAYGVFLYMIGGLDRTEVDEDNLSVNESVNEKVINIALYGIDSRNHDYNGRSDVVMVASVNTKTGQVKLVSIARDTYVAIPGYNNTRINHAFSYGGPDTRIKIDFCCLGVNHGMSLDPHSF